MDFDTQLQQAVVTELASDPEIESDITIKVLRGNVTLSGNIGSYVGWRKAVHAAERVAGIGRVSVDLAATFPHAPQRGETGILKLLEEALTGTAWRRSPEIDEELDAGPPARLDRQGIAATAASLQRDYAPNHNVAMQDSPVAHEVLLKIEAALLRRGRAHMISTISVAVHGGTTALTGNVRSQAERQLALDAARSTPRVTTVIDNLLVSSFRENNGTDSLFM